MHEHEKRVLEGLLFLSGDEGLSIEKLNGCVEELDKKEIEVVLDELMQDYLADVHGSSLFALAEFINSYPRRQSIRMRRSCSALPRWQPCPMPRWKLWQSSPISSRSLVQKSRKYAV